MNKQEIPSTKNAPIDVWTSLNIAVYRQLGFWHDTKKVYQFIPASPTGYVVICPHGQKSGCKPLKGYVVNRPAALQLSWDTNRSVTFCIMTLKQAIAWQCSAHIPFQSITARLA